MPRLWSCVIGIALVASLGCEEKVVQGTGGGAQAAVQEADGGADAAATEPALELQEADFLESERSRDPFRSFAGTFLIEETGQIKSDRPVVLDQYHVEELKLAGIVTRIQPPKAMFVDPTGRGHVVSRGQFIGRAEVVRGSGTGADYEVNWRVQRIRTNDVVLVREDPANPDVPSATRVIPLRTEVESVE